MTTIAAAVRTAPVRLPCCGAEDGAAGAPPEVDLSGRAVEALGSW